jgi:hypothetical protein
MLLTQSFFFPCLTYLQPIFFLGNLGSMLWSQFSPIFAHFRPFSPIFGEKIGIIRIKHKHKQNSVMFSVKNANFFRRFFVAKIFKKS